MLFGGFVMMAVSLWYKTGWSLEIDWHPVVWTGLLQGVGLGLVFVPLNVMSFATLPSEYRTDGAGLLSLSRNIGASLGISVVSFLLARNIQISHADLAGHITAFRSEEHTSELQSLMRISYAVFCLKKKTLK